MNADLFHDSTKNPSPVAQIRAVTGKNKEQSRFFIWDSQLSVIPKIAGYVSE